LKTIILAGGFGTRLAEETALKPKPMIEIGGHPMLWHIMNIYAAHGFREFLVACGYRGDVIKEYFASFYLRNGDLDVDLSTGALNVQRRHDVDWKVACVDTGSKTMTGGRIKALEHMVGDSTFMVTYGDGVADVDLGALLRFHKSHSKLATVTAVRPPARFGTLNVSEVGAVETFQEKAQGSEGWLNGGFFVFEPEVFSYIKSPDTRLEGEPLAELASAGELMAFRHDSFWQPMDTLRERMELERLWESGAAPWKVW